MDLTSETAMPIRFRCVYCDKLLGIARRKAGAVVNCPHCSEKLIVPTPEPEVGAVAPSEDELKGTDEAEVDVPAGGGAVKLFEQNDFDALLEAEPTFRAVEPRISAPAPAREPELPAPQANVPTTPLPPPHLLPQLPKQSPALAPSPFLTPDPKHPPGYFFSPAKATWLSVAVVVLVALAFGGGLIVGKMMGK